MSTVVKQGEREEAKRRWERWRMQVCGHTLCVLTAQCLSLAHQSNLHRDRWHPESYEHETQPSEQVPSRVPRLARNKPLWQDIWKLFHFLQWKIGAQWTISRYLSIFKMKYIQPLCTVLMEWWCWPFYVAKIHESNKLQLYDVLTTKVFVRYKTRPSCSKRCTITIYCSHVFLLHEMLDITSDIMEWCPTSACLKALLRQR